MLNLPCECECHHFCHMCGRELFGPNDYHINCGDYGSGPGKQNLYQGPDRNEPWPATEPPPETFTDFEREGYGDHEPTA